ncbi:MAG: ABC transporter substrate-binding protein [Pseudomonadota bacterium]
MVRFRPFALAAAFAFAASPATAEIALTIGFLKHEEPAPPTLSNLDPIPEDLGLAGARLGLADVSKTGRFLGFDYDLSEAVVGEDEDPLTAAQTLLDESPLLVLDAPAATVAAIADLPEAAGALIFNAGAEDDALRGEACRVNVLHTAVSYAMRADALAQFMTKKRWTDWALIVGEHPKDVAFAEALRRSGEKFRLDLVGEKTWAFDADMRRNAAQEVPLFTQDLGEHDVLVLADEIHDFGRYVLYNAWTPRPVAGSEGLTPAGWSGAVEQWGAAQLQSRFRKLATRDMRARDYAAWAAIAAIGEAAIREKTADAAALRAYMLGGAFELAGFKGRPLTFRAWNGQLRQPVPLTHPRALAALAPLEGFLHQRNELDTLGIDEAESACAAFAAE